MPTLSNQVHPYSTFLTDKGCAPARAAVDCPITTSGAAPLIVDGFRRVRRSTFTAGAIKEKGPIQSALASVHGRNGKRSAKHATPDAPERIDHRRRCTPTRSSDVLPRIARERVPTVSHVAKTRRNVPRRIAPTAHLNATTSIICETVHQGFFAEMESIRPHSGCNPRLLCLANVILDSGVCALPKGRILRDAS